MEDENGMKWQAHARSHAAEIRIDFWVYNMMVIKAYLLMSRNTSTEVWDVFHTYINRRDDFIRWYQGLTRQLRN